jgi:hypothetical protein
MLRVVPAVLSALFFGHASAFHTPYRPEQSRHFDVTKSSTFKPITTKVGDGDASAG